MDPRQAERRGPLCSVSGVLRTGSRDEATRGFLQALLAHDARVKDQEAEKDRVGYDRLNGRLETGWSKVFDIETTIKEAQRRLGSRGRREPDDRHST